MKVLYSNIVPFVKRFLKKRREKVMFILKNIYREARERESLCYRQGNRDGLCPARTNASAAVPQDNIFFNKTPSWFVNYYDNHLFYAYCIN
jgi:hypothetical protein